MAPKKASVNSTTAVVQRLPFEINKDRIAELFKSIHNKPGFIVDFDDVWPVLHWSRKDNAIAALLDERNEFRENEDYIRCKFNLASPYRRFWSFLGQGSSRMFYLLEVLKIQEPQKILSVSFFDTKMSCFCR